MLRRLATVGLTVVTLLTFEAAHPGVKVVFNFAGSSALAQQINQDAPAEVFASAATKNMDQVTDKGAATTFVKNRLELKITGLADFGDADKKIALCAQQVPCGAAAKKLFEAAKITAKPDSLEQDVKAALTKVSLGEVDGIEFPEADKAINEYPIATLTKAPNASGAKAFVDYVLSGKGRTVLTRPAVVAAVRQCSHRAMPAARRTACLVVGPGRVAETPVLPACVNAGSVVCGDPVNRPASGRAARHRRAAADHRRSDPARRRGLRRTVAGVPVG